MTNALQLTIFRALLLTYAVANFRNIKVSIHFVFSIATFISLLWINFLPLWCWKYFGVLRNNGRQARTIELRLIIHAYIPVHSGSSCPFQWGNITVKGWFSYPNLGFAVALELTTFMCNSSTELRCRLSYTAKKTEYLLHWKAGFKLPWKAGYYCIGKEDIIMYTLKANKLYTIDC